MDYGKILRRAVEITWRHRALWFFGFLLALFSGGGSGGSGQGLQYRIGETELARPEWIWGLVLLVIVLVVVLVVVGAVLSNISRGALIGMVRETEEAGVTSVRSGWRIGLSRLWSLIGIDLLTVIPTVIVAMALIALAVSPLLLLLARQEASLATREALTVLSILLTVLLSLAVVAVLIVAGIALGILRELAYRQCVLEGHGAWQSIREGYRTLRADLRQVGVMWLLLSGINLAVSVVAFPLVLVVIGLAFGAGAAVYSATESAIGAVVVGLSLGLPAFLLLALTTGVYLAFQSTAWTLAYREVQAQS